MASDASLRKRGLDGGGLRFGVVLEGGRMLLLVLVRVLVDGELPNAPKAPLTYFTLERKLLLHGTWVHLGTLSVIGFRLLSRPMVVQTVGIVELDQRRLVIDGVFEFAFFGISGWWSFTFTDAIVDIVFFGEVNDICKLSLGVILCCGLGCCSLGREIIEEVIVGRHFDFDAYTSRLVERNRRHQNDELVFCYPGRSHLRETEPRLVLLCRGERLYVCG